MKKVIWMTLLCLSLYSSIVFANIFSVNEQQCLFAAQNLKQGDLLFLEINNPIFENVGKATQSWASHVGVVMREDGKWLVYESTVPKSRKTELCAFLKKAKKWRYAILRPHFLVGLKELAKMRTFLEQKIGVSYDLGFDYQSDKLFCSKMVYRVYLSVFHREIGKIKTFRQLLEENPESNLTFWNIWFMGNIPWQRLTVTPKDQLLDDDLYVVYSWDHLRNGGNVPVKNENSIQL